MPEAIDPDKVYELLDQDGNVAYRKGADLDKAFGMGMRLASAGDQVARFQAESEEEYFSSPLQQTKAVAGSLASGASLGLSDLAMRAASTDEEWEETQLGRQHNAKKSQVANIAGAVIPGLLSGGTGLAGSLARATPAGLAARGGSAVAQRLGGGVLATGAGLGVEGFIQGAGQGLQQVTESVDPIDLEHALGTISTSAMVGGAGGFGIGVLGKAAGKGYTRAKAVIDDARAARSTTDVADDLAPLVQAGDRAGLRALRETEEAALKDANVAARAKAADDILAGEAELDASGIFLAAQGKPRAVISKMKNRIRNLADNPVDLRANPGKAIDPLQRRSEALRKMVADAPEMSAKLAAEDGRLAKGLAEELATLPDGTDAVRLEGKLARRYADVADARLGKDGSTTITRAEASDLLGAFERGEIQGARAKALESTQKLLDANEARIARIQALYEKPMSPRLAQIDAAFDVMAGGKAGKGLLEQTTQGVAFGAVLGALPTIPVVGPVLAPLIAGKAASKLVDFAFGRTGKAAAASAARTSAAVDAFLDVGARVAPRAAAATVPLATRVLSSASFGPPTKDERPEPIKAKEPELVASFRARERELRAQVARGPDGAFAATPQARARIAEQLVGVAAVAPVVADQIETLVARRLEFLASKLPLRPDFLATRTGPETWRPTDMEMRAFARYVAAVEDPGAVEERLVAGTVTLEDAEAYRAVYPERFAKLQLDIVSKLPELRASLPYERQIALSVFTGVPVDPAMQPSVLARLQSTYGQEPGSGGGQMAPRAAPQFGSVTAKDMEPTTPAQERGMA